MSATGRNLDGADRQADDFYATPGWCTRAIFAKLSVPLDGDTVLDPCAGEGAILREVDELAYQALARGIEIDPVRAQTAGDRIASGEVICRDALDPDPWGRPDLILTNPPYGAAMHFVERALREVVPGGEVAMLLRLPWLASQERAAFHRSRPSDVYILPRRPSFVQHLRWTTAQCPHLVVGNGKSKPPRCQLEKGHALDCRTLGTDSADYAWFVWGPGRGGRWEILDVEARS